MRLPTFDSQFRDPTLTLLLVTITLRRRRLKLNGSHIISPPGPHIYFVLRILLQIASPRESGNRTFRPLCTLPQTGLKAKLGDRPLV